MNREQWHVLGAGSIGCLWGASLRHKGFSTELILKTERFQALNTATVEITLHQHKEVQKLPVSVTSPETMAGLIDRLIVCTKAQDALSAMGKIAHHLTPETRILLLQNGMGSQQAIRDQYPELNIWAGSVTDGAYLNGVFDVCHAGEGNTVIGPVTPHGRSSDYRDLTGDFPLNVQIVADIEQQLWHKLSVNCCINGLTALFNCRNGELLENRAYRLRLEPLINETAGIMEALGISAAGLMDRVFHICQITADNVSSTCQDARLNRTTELHYMNGFLLRKAEANGLSTSIHRRLMAELAALGIY